MPTEHCLCEIDNACLIKGTCNHPTNKELCKDFEPDIEIDESYKGDCE